MVKQSSLDNSQILNDDGELTIFFDGEQTSVQTNILLDHIKGASTSVKICMYYFCSKDIIKELLALKKEVKIEIITQNEDNIDIKSLGNISNIDIYYFESSKKYQQDKNQKMHLKCAIIDGFYVIKGSQNWTNKGLETNFEYTEISRKKDTAVIFNKQFERIKQEIPKVHKNLSKKHNLEQKNEVKFDQKDHNILQKEKENLQDDCQICQIYFPNQCQNKNILQCGHTYCNKCLTNEMIKKGDNNQHKSDKCYVCKEQYQLSDFINLNKKKIITFCLKCKNVQKRNIENTTNDQEIQQFLTKSEIEFAQNYFFCDNCKNTQCNQCLIFPYHFDEKCEQQNKSCYFCNDSFSLKLFMEKNQIKICEKCYKKKQDMCLSNLQNDQLCLGEKNHNKCFQNQDQFLMQQESICKFCQNDLKKEKCLQIDCGHIHHIECIKKLNKDELNCLICIEPLKIKDTLQLKCKQCQKQEQKWSETNLILDLIKDEQQMQKKKKIEEYICDQCFHDNSKQNIICEIHYQEDLYFYKCKFCCNYAFYEVNGQYYRCDDCYKNNIIQIQQCQGVEYCPLKINHEEGSIFMGCQICLLNRNEF
ncbi:hypothetical protein PPERSA_02103 [Pseudocohnilembus persalinus]|uniref:Mitochondrial cardiolipin hydrolase n=1 Tax=Pseudocohnilembus persalinus TaxID=266149 RepID=A0A0V0Q7Z6_PSEPJ|nr:hypothetical protein PPERSA_02103 [Pseudocohnilembus persalinus]|eukprot:KRW98326.1 hypothetical protein PPERSA_02103 [Pseudocohnilembus persalinus]